MTHPTVQCTVLMWLLGKLCDGAGQCRDGSDEDSLRCGAGTQVRTGEKETQHETKG